MYTYIYTHIYTHIYIDIYTHAQTKNTPRFRVPYTATKLPSSSESMQNGDGDAISGLERLGDFETWRFRDFETGPFFGREPGFQ